MEEMLLSAASENGIWVLLFVSLLMYVIYDSNGREIKYRETIRKNQDIIFELTQSLKTVDDIQNTLYDITRKLDGR